MMEAVYVSAEPRYMPDGSVDWVWFHQRGALMKKWLAEGLCREGCGRARAGASIYCSPCHSIRSYRYKGPTRCSFCGKEGDCPAGALGPTMPIEVRWCSYCREMESYPLLPRGKS